jgi:MoCo/4Fe-4S cofactor protein with predicted Tat translocation signal
MSKKYWKGLPELNNSEDFLQNKNNEFAEDIANGRFPY